MTSRMEQLPPSLASLHQSLRPYIRQAHEVAHIRRILALHFRSSFGAEQSVPLPAKKPLFLLEARPSSGATLTGTRREYSRCLQAHQRASEEYQKMSQNHVADATDDWLEPSSERLARYRMSLELHSNMIRDKRKVARLKILHDYIERLSRMPPAQSGYLSAEAILRDVKPIPEIPKEVMVSTQLNQNAPKVDVDDLLSDMEKSILRGKVILKREWKLLNNLKMQRIPDKDLEASSATKMDALEAVRHELISWIESELLESTDIPPEMENGHQIAPFSVENDGPKMVEIAKIRELYSRYSEARQSWISTASSSTGPSIDFSGHTDVRSLSTPILSVNAENTSKSKLSSISQPYLEDLVSMAQFQKSIFQQRSHLTSSFAQLTKGANEDLNRLAEESHLLRTFPTADLHQSEQLNTVSFGQEARRKLPETQNKARKWATASAMAERDSKEMIMDRHDEARAAASEVKGNLSRLQFLTGNGDGKMYTSSGDVWASLNGHLGSIVSERPEHSMHW